MEHNVEEEEADAENGEGQLGDCVELVILQAKIFSRLATSTNLLSAYRLKGHFFCQMALLFMIDPISRHISRTSHVLRIFDFVLFN